MTDTKFYILNYPTFGDEREVIGLTGSRTEFIFHLEETKIKVPRRKLIKFVVYGKHVYQNDYQYMFRRNCEGARTVLQTEDMCEAFEDHIEKDKKYVDLEEVEYKHRGTCVKGKWSGYKTSKLNSEAYRWCQKNGIKYKYIYHWRTFMEPIGLMFKSEEDTLLFKMKFI